MVQLTLLTTCLSQHVLYMSQHVVSKVSWCMQVSNERCSQQGLLDQTGLVIRHVTNAARSIRPMRHTVGQSMYGKISSSLLVHYSVCVIFLLWPVVFFHWQGSHV